MYSTEMETTTTNLIQAVDRAREKRQLTDRKFSMDVLGVSPSLWCRLKSGERPPTLDTLTIILKKLPELSPVVCSYMSERQISENSRKNDGEQVGLGNYLPPPFERAGKPSKNAG